MKSIWQYVWHTVNWKVFIDALLRIIITRYYYESGIIVIFNRITKLIVRRINE